MSEQTSLFGSISSAGGSHAKTSQWLEAVRDWLATDPDSSTSSCALLMRSLPAGWSSKMSMAFAHRTEDGIWEPYSQRWESAGIGGPTVCLTLSSSAHPSDGAASSLSDILEPHVPPKFFLSLKACHGILRRAARRGKALPPELKAALEAVVATATEEELAELEEELGDE